VAGTSIPRKWISRIQDALEPGEDVELAIAEHRIGSPKPFERAILFCTNKRLIIMRRNIIGTYRTYKIIHYDEVMEVILHRGLHFSRIHFGMHGEERETEEWKRWVWGLDHREAQALVHYMEKRREGIKMEVDRSKEVRNPHEKPM
jgi:hypothetical protein